jgi:hypothetical protein
MFGSFLWLKFYTGGLFGRPCPFKGSARDALTRDFVALAGWKSVDATLFSRDTQDPPHGLVDDMHTETPRYINRRHKTYCRDTYNCRTNHLL